MSPIKRMTSAFSSAGDRSSRFPGGDMPFQNLKSLYVERPDLSIFTRAVAPCLPYSCRQQNLRCPDFCPYYVFAAYVSGKGHAFIDRALYLLKAWADDPARRAAAHVPQQIAFATKPHLARAMVERAIAAGVPFAWVVGDSIYGVSEIEMALRRA